MVGPTDEKESEGPGAGELRKLNPPSEASGGGGTAIAIAALLLLAVAAFGYYIANIEAPRPPDFGKAASLLPTPRAISAFELVDSDGARFDHDRLVGKWSLFFFGYTYCPDICPTTLQTLGRVKAHWDELQASEEADASFEPPQVVFVSVDPERDSPERIGEYVGYFDSRFVGVTGEPIQLQILGLSVGAYFKKVKPEGSESTSATGYLMNHSAKLYLVDPQARLRAVLDDPHDIEEFANLVTEIQRIVQDS